MSRMSRLEERERERESNKTGEKKRKKKTEMEGTAWLATQINGQEDQTQAKRFRAFKILSLSANDVQLLF